MFCNLFSSYSNPSKLHPARLLNRGLAEAHLTSDGLNPIFPQRVSIYHLSIYHVLSTLLLGTSLYFHTIEPYIFRNLRICNTRTGFQAIFNFNLTLDLTLTLNFTLTLTWNLTLTLTSINHKSNSAGFYWLFVI